MRALIEDEVWKIVEQINEMKMRMKKKEEIRTI